VQSAVQPWRKVGAFSPTLGSIQGKDMCPSQ
jgi:hypothetical protein